MSRINATNERIKHDYVRFLKNARGKSEATIDVVRKAIARFEEYTGARDFKTLRRDQAIGFKEKLSETEAIRSGDRLSYATQAATLAALREFFGWLACQPGFKSKIHLPDVEYFNLSLKDAAKAKAIKVRDFPSIDHVRAAIAGAPVGSVVERRNRALLAFAILTGMRDRAMASLSLRHIDLTKSPPLVRQEPDRVATKFSKAIPTYFFPIGDDLERIVRDWIDELQTEHRFGASDPLFPKTRIVQGHDHSFRSDGVEPAHWSDASPIRAIFKEAFTRVGLPYFPPHSFRHTLVHLMQTVCRSPEQMKAWSQNLGHEHVATTLTSYGTIDPYRQGTVLAGISISSHKPEQDILGKIRELVGATE